MRLHFDGAARKTACVAVHHQPAIAVYLNPRSGGFAPGGPLRP
jgi:hypothetical protein